MLSGAKHSAIATFFLFSIGATSVADVISQVDCNHIIGYNSRNDRMNFSDHLIHMVHSTEVCPEYDSCSVLLSKWSSDFSVKGTLVAPTENYNKIVYVNSVNYFKKIMRMHAGLTVNIVNKRPDEKYIKVVIFGDYQFDMVYEYYPGAEYAISAMEEKNIGCIALFSSNEHDGSLEVAHIFIDIDLSERDFARCVKEELYNVSGAPNDPVGDASLFDDDFLRPLYDAPLYDGYSAIERIILKIIYHERFENGFDAERTRQEFEIMYSESCE